MKLVMRGEPRVMFPCGVAGCYYDTVLIFTRLPVDVFRSKGYPGCYAHYNR